MKRYLILVVLTACVASGSAGTAPQHLPQSVATATSTTMHPAKVTKVSAQTRHLTDAERAELRRQLEQFNRQRPRHP